MPRCGKTLLFAWSISPFVFLLLGFGFFSAGGGLSTTFSAITFIIVAIYGAGTFKFTRSLLREEEVRKRLGFRLYTLAAVIGPTAYFIGKQFKSFRVDHHLESRSIFNDVWDSIGQTAYGYPSPFLRILDYSYEPYGRTIMDWMALFLNIWILFLVIFILVGAAAVLLEIITSRTKPAEEK